MDGIMEFKSLFPKGKINVGQAMYFRKMADGTMVIQLDEEVLGTVRNGWVIESFFMGYLDGQKPLSERAWTSIAQGIQDLLLQ
ncbi:hypothetical protein BGW38_008842 [Lunasporangiospora selenospora]|uniref:Chalcone isomerase domain-containing protein n=1 Tax=Lunasporangiospora selenospora TaxID=979761 RepID=A0A9P6FY00_9FUNG|nr:hypothetical protein BGW38_008842 [Lunasporangiospora selenospora]